MLTKQNRKKIRSTLFRYLMITLGVIIDGAALELFLVPNSVLDGGLTGIALMIQYQTGWMLGVIALLLNVPFIVVGWKAVGPRFSIAYAYAMLLFTAVTAYLHHFSAITDNEMLSVVFGGMLLGVGVGLVLKGGACIDGTELMALLISRHSSISVGQIILVFNLIIFTVAGFLFGPDRALLSLLTYIIASKVIDYVEQGFNQAKQAIIICNDAAPIATEIYHSLGRTMTILDARGMVSGKKDMMYCVLTRLELTDLKDIVDKYDGSAFITISDVSEIIGNHIKKVADLKQESQSITSTDSTEQ